MVATRTPAKRCSSPPSVKPHYPHKLRQLTMVLRCLGGIKIGLQIGFAFATVQKDLPRLGAFGMLSG